ncbi:MAG: diguanylate cyclase [Rubripirellula sp.]
MGKRLLASLRLAFSLVCVGASLILGAQWFGYLPDAAAIKNNARQQNCETIAIQSVRQISERDWVALRSTLQALVDRDPELMSIGVRSEFGTLRLDTGHHEKMWNPTVGVTNAADKAKIPITLNHRSWGNMEFCFRQRGSNTVDRLLANPTVQFVGFYILSGMVAFTIFVIRMMGVFSNTQVVPDRVRQALDTLAEGLLVLDGSGRIVLANQAFADLVGVEADLLTHKRASDLDWVADDVAESGYPWIHAIEKSELQSEQMLRITLTDGSQRIFSVNAAPLGKDRTQRGALATFRDVTHVEEHRAELERMLSLLRSSRDEIERKNRALEILATQDSLTGCLNRRAFFEKFDSIWMQAKSNDSALACIMVDVDHFKSVNDTYGHHAGDEVLRAVAQVIRTQNESDGVVCRYGGEEFCVLLPDMDIETALAHAEKTREAIAAIRLDDPEELRLTASLGVSELRFRSHNPQELVNQADACLYVAKREGRNRSIVYNASYSIIQDTEKILDEDKHDRVDIPFQAVIALVSALSYRDTDTAEHSRRVADLCARAGEGIFDPAERYILEIAGLLHDIGKIGIPDSILLKPGKLTPEEWEIMGRHDRIGVEIVSGSFECVKLTEIMANHHAFYGGHARDPELPTGEAIPQAARLLSIADSYDAMVSDRVYRPGRSHEEAVEELRRCAGTQFDPKLVEHFIEKISSTRAVFATGAIALRKQNALSIGTHVQALVGAVSNQDVIELQAQALRVASLAEDFQLTEIANIAVTIEQLAKTEDATWVALLRQSYDLVDLCRSTQSDFLKRSLERDAEQVNSQAK